MATQGPKRYPKSTRKKDALKSVARAHSGVNLTKPMSYYNDELVVDWHDQGRYEVVRQLGKGKYGDVYQGIDLVTGKTVVVKIMKPVRESRLLREVKILRHVSGGPHIVQLLDLVRDPETKTPTFVFEFVEAADYKKLIQTMTLEDVQLYIYQLLLALEHTHAKGIIHRDVKPPNFLIDPKQRRLTLIDWGLAEFYFPGKPYPVRVATRYYKSPEIMCDLRDYDYSMDLWAVGCTLGSMLFRKVVLFKGEDEFDQLVKIANVLGTDSLHAFLNKYGIELDQELAAKIGKCEKKPWSSLVTPGSQDMLTPDALDLLERLLTYDHQQRITAAEALQHPFFDAVRVTTPVETLTRAWDPVAASNLQS